MDRLLLRPLEAAQAMGIGRSKIYELLAGGEIPSIRIGGFIRVPLDALKEWIEQKTATSKDLANKKLEGIECEGGRSYNDGKT